MNKIDLKYGIITDDNLQLSDQLIFENIYIDIINESYIKLEYFQKFFDIINNDKNFSQIYSKQDIINLFPARWRAKKYLRNSKIKGRLIIFKIDFNSTEQIINCLKFLQAYTQKKLTKEKFQNLVLKILHILTMSPINAFFFQIANITQYSLMFVQKNFSIADFRHEFIHYYQWVTGREIAEISIDFNTIDKIPLEIDNLANLNNLSFNIDNLIKKEEIIPYANDLVEQVKLFPQYNKFTFGYEYCQHQNETSDEYINRMIQTDFYNFLISNKQNLIPFTVFVLCNYFDINKEYFFNYIFRNV